MKRALKLSLGVAAIGSMVMPNGAHAALGEFARVRLHSNGDQVSLGVLSPGVYDLTTVGTYVYDKDTKAPLITDGECSVGSDAVGETNTVWHDPIDTVENIFGKPGIFSTWHRWRYGVNGDDLLFQNQEAANAIENASIPNQLIYTGDVIDDTLDVYVQGDVLDNYVLSAVDGKLAHGQVWIPTYPDDPTGGLFDGLLHSPGDGIDVLCNTGTHQYDTIIVADGVNEVKLNIFDTNYVDNVDMKNDDTGPLGATCASNNDPTANCGLLIEVGQLL